MSTTPPRIATDLSNSSTPTASPVDPSKASKRPKQMQAMHHSADPAERQGRHEEHEEPSSIPLDSIKSDRKGKGRAIPEDEEHDITTNVVNYDLTLEQEQEQEHELERAQRQPQRYNGEYVDLANDEAAGDGVPGDYPPMADDEMEERRVQENLKRWEEAEKQRRKAARESYRRSSSSAGHNTSVMGDVTRKASKIWQEGARRRSSLRKGAVKLRDESQSPFDDRHSIVGGNHGKNDNSRHNSGNGSIGGNIKNGNASKPSIDNGRQTTLSLRESQRSASPSSPTPLVSQNPFHTPRTGSPTSFTLDESKHQSIPFTPITGRRDSQENGALMEGTSNPSTPTPDRITARGRHLSGDDEELDSPYKDRPILQASSSYSLDTFPTQKRTSLPTPKPIDLPREISPPPRQPGAISPPTLQRTEADILEDEELAEREAQQGRWWTDWLCGCRESGRQGQDQSGRTNPFE